MKFFRKKRQRLDGNGEMGNGTKNIRVKRFNDYYKITPKNIHVQPINQYVLRFNNIVFCNKLLRHYLVTSKVRQTRRFDIFIVV